MYINVLKVFAPAAISFFIGIAITPFVTDFLYSHKMWKKKAGKVDPAGCETPIFNELHKGKEVGTPRMGGLIIWLSVLITIILFWLASSLFPNSIFQKLSFLSRNQTWLPFFTLIFGALLGLIDDISQVMGEGGAKSGLSFSKRVLIVTVLGAAVGWWFYSKLSPEYQSLHIPFDGTIALGIWFIPFFVFVMLALFSSGVIDGLDGLSGGVMSIIFSAYAGIAYFQGQIDLAAFCVVVVGGILAFLWFNIPPARFYMSETGILGLTTALTVVAFLTKSVVILPLIAFPLFVTSLSVIVQLLSKKLRGKKVFKVAPLHHHFEAIGWPAYKVVMRYWVITIITAIIGLVITLIGQ